MSTWLLAATAVVGVATVALSIRRAASVPASEETSEATPDQSRRSLLQYATGAAAGLAGLTLAGRESGAQNAEDGGSGGGGTYGGAGSASAGDSSGGEYPDSFVGYMGTQGKVAHDFNGFDPMEMLVDWSYGQTSELPNGQTLREYEWKAIDKEIEIAPGIRFPAWTYEGRVPGPTIRCKEGDRIRIEFTNVGSHPHTIHFHGIHPFEMDGVPGAGPGEIPPGETFTYEFDAKPYGCHFYHCHSIPLKRHIHKGLYGAFIVDPPEGRPPARE
ncbi:MAG: multicopper oxidase domain-containing protein, partial [Bradymonadaceae bacterium]